MFDDTAHVVHLPITDVSAPQDCQACGAEGTFRHPVLQVDLIDSDSTRYTRLCAGCLEAFEAEQERRGDRDDPAVRARRKRSRTTEPQALIA